MWRIPVFLLGFACVLGSLTLSCVALVAAKLGWAAVIVLIIGASAAALLAFPAISWVMEGRWGGFYRAHRGKDKAT
jgi:hypothetical protein